MGRGGEGGVFYVKYIVTPSRWGWEPLSPSGAASADAAFVGCSF